MHPKRMKLKKKQISQKWSQYLPKHNTILFIIYNYKFLPTINTTGWYSLKINIFPWRCHAKNTNYWVDFSIKLGETSVGYTEGLRRPSRSPFWLKGLSCWEVTPSVQVVNQHYARRFCNIWGAYSQKTTEIVVEPGLVVNHDNAPGHVS